MLGFGRTQVFQEEVVFADFFPTWLWPARHLVKRLRVEAAKLFV